MYKLESGQSVSKYCRSNKISYDCIWNRITFKNMTPDQAVEDYLSKRGKPHIYKWMYKGVVLSQYCKNNNLPYQKIVNTYYNLNHKNKINRKNITMEEVVEMYERGENKKQKKYFYHGKPLKMACEEYGINYIHVINAYLRYNFYNVNKKPCTIEEVVDYYRVDDPVDHIRNY